MSLHNPIENLDFTPVVPILCNFLIRILPPVWPAALCPSLLEFSAARLAQLDASPVRSEHKDDQFFLP